MIISPGITLRPGVTMQSYGPGWIPPISAYHAITATLTVSLAAYNAAATNTAVPITAAEYAKLQILYGSTQTSVSDDGFGTGWFVGATQIGTATTVFRNYSLSGIGSHMPSSGFDGRLMTAGYVYAFKTINRYASTSTPAVNIGYAASSATSAVSLCYAPSTTAVSDSSGYAYYVIKNPLYSLTTSGYYPTLWQGTSSGVASGFNGILSAPFSGAGNYVTPASNITIATTSTKTFGLDTLYGYQFLQTPYVNWTQTPDANLVSSGTNMLNFPVYQSSTIELNNPAFNTTTFTIEAWIFMNSATEVTNVNTSTGSSNNVTIWGPNNNILNPNTTYSFTSYLRLSGTYISAQNNGMVIDFTAGNFTPVVNTWYHIAVTSYDSGTGTCYINGVANHVINPTQYGYNYQANTSSSIVLGWLPAVSPTDSGFQGYIRDFRFTKKVVYTGNFSVTGSSPAARGKIAYTQSGAYTNIASISPGDVACLLTLPNNSSTITDWTFGTTIITTTTNAVTSITGT